MIKKLLANFTIMLIAMIVSFLLAEVATRTVGKFDDTGQFFFRDRLIPPFTIPTAYTSKIIDEYKANEDKALIIYDAQMGWNLQPNYQNQKEGLYINSNSIRSTSEYSLDPQDDVLRIALFGDSYTFDANVSNEDMWATILQEELIKLGINAEVINFGVNGYGMDQAYLRWNIMGKQYQPDIVIFGFVMKNAQRNVNVFRQILNPDTGIPFTKPRFVIENDELQLVNSPTVPLDEIVSTLENFHNSELSRYEAYYDSRYSQKWWLNSKFLSVLFDTFGSNQTEANPDGYYVPSTGQEHVRIAEAITRQFSESVSENNSQFVVAYLPDKRSYRYSNNDVDAPYLEAFDLLPQLEDDYIFFDAELAFVDDGGIEFPSNQSHYNRAMNQKIGRYFAEQLVDCIQSDSCQFSRFDDFVFLKQ